MHEKGKAVIVAMNSATVRRRSRRLVSGCVAAACLGLAVTGCGSGQEDTSGEGQWDLSAPPADVVWEKSVGCLELPLASTAGPSVKSPIPQGFDRSPQGAVLAAMVGHGFLAAADDSQWPAVVREVTAPGPGRDQWSQARSMLHVEGCMEDPPRFVGFRVGQFNENEAVVIVLTEQSGGVRYAMPTQVSWQDDDWKLVLPDQGEAPDAVLVERMDGFTELSPPVGD